MARAEKEEEEGGERGTAPFTALVIEEAEATEGGREKVAQKKQVFPQPYILTMLLFSAVLHTEDRQSVSSIKRKFDRKFPARQTCRIPETLDQFFSLVARMFRRHSRRAKKEEGGRKGARRFFPQRCAREEKKPRPKL